MPRGYPIKPADWDRWTWLALVALFVASLLLINDNPGFLGSAGLAGFFLLVGLLYRGAAALRRRLGRRWPPRP